MTDEATFPAELDPNKTFIVSAFGRKGSGKSNFQRLLYHSYPFDKLCVDVNGDADPGPDAVRITELEPGMPRPHDDGRPHNLHFIADPGSPTYFDDLDRAVGMAMFPRHRPTLVWCDEFGEFTRGNKTGAHMRRLLMQNRHYKTSLLIGGPRPIDVDKLGIAQSDLVAIFDLPDPDDRERVAKVIGYPTKRFPAELDETIRRGEHHYLLFDARLRKLFRMPPAPLAHTAG